MIIVNIYVQNFIKNITGPKEKDILSYNNSRKFQYPLSPVYWSLGQEKNNDIRADLHYRSSGLARHPQNIQSNRCREHILLRSSWNFHQADYIAGYK